MTSLFTTDSAISDGNPADHLWMHFARMGNYADKPVPIVVRGEGAYIYDAAGRRYLDALSALFVVQSGYGRDEIATAMPPGGQSPPPASSRIAPSSSLGKDCGREVRV